MKWCVELFDDSESEPDFERHVVWRSVDASHPRNHEGGYKEDEPMECDICKRTADKDGVVLHRINETGVKGIWRCAEHLTPPQRAQVDPIVDDVVRIIKQDNQKA